MMMLMQGSGKDGFQLHTGNKCERVSDWKVLVSLLFQRKISYIIFSPIPDQKEAEELCVYPIKVGIGSFGRAVLDLPENESFLLCDVWPDQVLDVEKTSPKRLFGWAKWFPKGSNPVHVRHMNYGFPKGIQVCGLRTRHWSSRIREVIYEDPSFRETDLGLIASLTSEMLTANEQKLFLIKKHYFKKEMEILFLGFLFQEKCHFRLFPKEIFHYLIQKIIFEGDLPKWADPVQQEQTYSSRW